MHDHWIGRLPGFLICRDVTRHMTEYLDNRLPVRTEFRLWQHLKTCADCRAYADQLRLLRQTLPLIPVQTLSLSQHLRLRQHFLNSRLRSADGAGL